MKVVLEVLVLFRALLSWATQDCPMSSQPLALTHGNQTGKVQFQLVNCYPRGDLGPDELRRLRWELKDWVRYPGIGAAAGERKVWK